MTPSSTHPLLDAVILEMLYPQQNLSGQPDTSSLGSEHELVSPTHPLLDRQASMNHPQPMPITLKLMGHSL
jgi:hypothetical protein